MNALNVDITSMLMVIALKFNHQTSPNAQVMVKFMINLKAYVLLFQILLNQQMDNLCYQMKQEILLHGLLIVQNLPILIMLTIHVTLMKITTHPKFSSWR